MPHPRDVGSFGSQTMASNGTPRTPRTRGSAKRDPTTPGDASVLSKSSTGSFKPGVPWNIQKQLAQELENAFPINLCPEESNSALALDNLGHQGFSKFLDDLVAADPENNSVFGKRGDEFRGKLRDLVYNWKKKSSTEYRTKVLFKFGVKLTPIRNRKKSAAAKQVQEEVDSDLSDEFLPQIPTKPATVTKSDPLIGKTIGSTPKNAAKAAAPKVQETKRSIDISKESKSGTKTFKMSASPFNLLSDGIIQGT